MRAVILVGHGSLLRGSGAAMIRLAARAREQHIAPYVAAGFLNYSRPAFGDVLAHAVERGATDVIVQPYFLVPGWFVSRALPPALDACRAMHPQVALRVARPLEDHPALAEILLRRARAATPDLAGRAALVIVAHGSPDPAANWPVDSLAAQLRAICGGAVSTAYLGLNEPPLPDELDRLARAGERQIIVVPYFLQLGGHVAEDLPALIAAARQRHPAATILLAEHLGYDPLLVSAIADRVAEVAA
jgi:sirohydrochlorin cobaltochelatase